MNEPIRLSSNDVIDVARHVAGLAGSGLALPPGLRALAQELPAPGTARALNTLADRLERGDSLDEALQAEGARFPAHLRGLVRAGLRTGRLAEVLGQFAEYERTGSELRWRVWVHLLYPLFLLCGLIGVFVFFSWYVVLEMDKVLRDFGVDLPIMTRWLLRLAHMVTQAGWGVIVAPAVGALALWLLGKGVPHGGWRRRISSNVPLTGPLWRWAALAEFSNLLALLIEAEIPVGEALPLAAEGVRDADLAVICDRMAEEVDAGAGLAETLTRWWVYPRGFAKLLEWAEAGRSLPEALRMAADTFAARARAQASFIGVFGTVTAVLLVVWGVSFILIGLYLPMIQLISRLSG